MDKIVNKKVYRDYRDNIIIDADNPILAFKANRDRFVKHDIYKGLAHLGSINSEDALTWNVFRYLDSYNILFLFSEILKNGNFNDVKLLVWSLAFNDKDKELQYVVGSEIRRIDGKYRGQITEPDIIIETEDEVYIIECKLGMPESYPGHLWEGKGNGPVKRFEDYLVEYENPFINMKECNEFYQEAYQLFRMAFYAYRIGRILKKKSYIVSLVNKTWWELKKQNSSPKFIWEQFCVKYLDDNKIGSISITWQCIRDHLNNTGNGKELIEYLNNHRCL